MRPKRTVNVLPDCEISQNFRDAPPMNSKWRAAPGARTETAGAGAGTGGDSAGLLSSVAVAFLFQPRRDGGCYPRLLLNCGR